MGKCPVPRAEKVLMQALRAGGNQPKPNEQSQSMKEVAQLGLPFSPHSHPKSWFHGLNYRLCAGDSRFQIHIPKVDVPPLAPQM